LNKLKLISDFDGIWTNQNIEAEYVWDHIVNTTSGLTGFGHKKVLKILEDCKLEMSKNPHLYGWFNTGGIAAYY